MLYEATARAGIDISEVKIEQDNFKPIVWVTIPKAKVLDIKVDTKIILPIISDNLTIECSIPIAMKVVQGTIPNYYINGFTTKSNITN